MATSTECELLRWELVGDKVAGTIEAAGQILVTFWQDRQHKSESMAMHEECGRMVFNDTSVCMMGTASFAGTLQAQGQ